MRNINTTVLSAPDTASANGAAVDSNQLVSASFQAVFGDATAVGTFLIQASNDIYNDRYNFNQGTFAPTNWSPIPGATTPITAGGLAIILIPVCSFRWLRAVYTSASGGTTTITVNMNAISV